MSTSTQLKEEFRIAERELLDQRRRNEERIKKAKQRVFLIGKKSEEVMEKHERALNNIEGEFENAQLNVERKGTSQVTAAREAELQAQGRMRQAELSARAAEREAWDIRKEVDELQRRLNEMVVARDKKVEALMARAEATIRKQIDTSNGVVEHECRCASDAFETSFASVESMKEEVRIQQKTAEARSAESSRLKDLYQVYALRSHQKLSTIDFEGSLAEIMHGWYGAWAEKAATEMQQIVEVRNATKVDSTGQPRSMERQRQAAAVRQALLSARGVSVCDFKPHYLALTDPDTRPTTASPLGFGLDSRTMSPASPCGHLESRPSTSMGTPGPSNLNRRLVTLSPASKR